MPRRTYKDFDTMGKITKNLKYEIETCGKSVKDIASEIGVTISTVCDYMSGRSYPNLILFKKLCDAIDVSADSILDTKG